MQIDKLANRLWKARKTGDKFKLDKASIQKDSLTITDAYKIQRACTEAAGADGIVAGYKIGATVQEALNTFGLEEPFYGPLYKSLLDSHTNQEQPLQLPLYLQHGSRIEAEFVVSMKSTLVRCENDVVVADLLDHIDWIAPGFELVASRVETDIAPMGSVVIADGGGNQHMVVGTPYKEWRDLDLTTLTVKLTVGDQAVIEGHSGMSITGHPLELVCWLLNHPSMHTTGLQAGDIISCGTCTGAIDLSAGQIVSADYGVLGNLAIQIAEK